ncbi:MAG: class I SAM-dependent methyltransferase, partial [Sphingomonadaceae bacterium]
MTDSSEWQGDVGQIWADHWHATDLSFSQLTRYLVEHILDYPFTRALDVGSGAGEVSIRIAGDQPETDILGIDISPALVETARIRSDLLANVDFVVGDASCWNGSRHGELWQPDMIMSRHGVMFFADPVQAFSNLHKNASDHAHLVFSCFRTRKDNIWASAVASLLPPGSGPDPDDNAPGPFAFARQDYVRTILSISGWKNITFEPIDYFHIAGRGKNALDDAIAFYSSIGPAAA